jgi:integrase
MKGSIRQRGATYTAYWFTKNPATGKRVQHTKGGFKTKGAAQKHLNSVLGKVDEGSWRPDRPITVKQLLEDHWLPAQRTAGIRPTTIEHYAGVVSNWIVPKIGAVKVAALTPEVVTRFADDLRNVPRGQRQRGLSARSTQMAVTTLKSACAWALQNELISRNPVQGVKRPRLQRQPMTSWSADQARDFLEATADDRLSFGWWLLLARGLRRGELCGLKWDDVDLEGRVLRINRTRVTTSGTVIDSMPKTESGRRSIPLDASLVATLRKHRTRQAAEKLRAGEAYREGGYLLADELGEPYNPDDVSKAFNAAVKAAGLPRIRLHDTRHTAASLMLAAGTPVKVVSDLLGHASPTITLATYAHVLPNMAEEAGAALSASLGG